MPEPPFFTGFEAPQSVGLAAIGIDDAEADVLQQLTAQDFEDFPT